MTEGQARQQKRVSAGLREKFRNFLRNLREKLRNYFGKLRESSRSFPAKIGYIRKIL